MLSSYIAIAVGGAAGGALRYAVGAAIDNRVQGPFPWGTWVVNVTGALLIGLLAGMMMRLDVFGGLWAATLMVGLCGSYTTVSSFSLQTLTLLQSRRWLTAGAYVMASLVVCLLATGLGYMMATSGVTTS